MRPCPARLAARPTVSRATFRLVAWLTSSLAAATAAADAYDPPAAYYSTAIGTGAALKSQLNNIVDGHTVRSYDAARSILQVTDADPNAPNPANSDFVLLVYNRELLDVSDIGDSIPGWNGSTWNREHTWPESRLGGGTSARSDLFNLRPSRNQINSDRGNLNFGGAYGQTYGVKSDGGTVWYPGNADAGMIARQQFYMDVRYDGVDSGGPNLSLVTGNPGDSGSTMGNLTRLVEWNYAAPPEAFERRRNQIIYDDYQGNRNPFTDRPEWVWSVFVDQANDSSLALQGGTVGAAGMTTLNVDLGRRLVNSELPANQSVTLSKSGVDGTYFSVTEAGAAKSSIKGRLNAFGVGSASTRAISVGLADGTSTAIAGLRSGTVTIDNLDVTASGGAGHGANDGNDVIDVKFSVLDHATPSFVDGSDPTTLTHNFGTITMGAPAPTFAFSIANLAATAGFTAGLDLDAIVGSGDTGVLTTNLTTFGGASTLAAASSRSFTATLGTSTSGMFSTTYTLSFSDENLVGATSRNSLTLMLSGVIQTAVVTSADFDGDGDVDGQDFVAWQGGVGTTGIAVRADGDANGDLNVDSLDLAVWRSQYGTTPPTMSAAVPEPATCLIATGGVGVFLHRRRRAQRLACA